MPTNAEWDAMARYQRENMSAIDREDNKNMAIANQIGGWGTGMTGAPSTGEAPIGVPGMAIPKSYGAVEEAFTSAITTPPAAIPRGESDIERAMASTSTGGITPYSGIPERLSARTAQVIERLGGKLRKSTRANLVNELSALTGTLGQLTGQELTRGTEEARIKEGRAVSAISGLPALAGMRKQAMEEAIAPWEMATKEMTARAEAARDIAATAMGEAETGKIRKEMAIMPETQAEAIKIHRAMNKPFAKVSAGLDEEKVYEGYRKAAIEEAKNASLPGKPKAPDFAKYATMAEEEIERRKSRIAQQEALKSPKKFAAYMRNIQGSKLSPEQLEAYWQEKYSHYAEEE